MVFRLSRKLDQVDANFQSFHDSGVFTELESIVANLSNDEFPKPSHRPHRRGRKKTSVGDKELEAKDKTTTASESGFMMAKLESKNGIADSDVSSSREPIRRSVLRAPSIDIDADFICLYGGPDPSSDVLSVASEESEQTAADALPAQLEIPELTGPLGAHRMCQGRLEMRTEFKDEKSTPSVALLYVAAGGVNSDGPSTAVSEDNPATTDPNTSDGDTPRRRRQSESKTRLSKRLESVEPERTSEDGVRSSLSRSSSHESNDSNPVAAQPSRRPRGQSTGHGGGGTRCSLVPTSKPSRVQSTGQGRSSLSRSSSHDSSESDPAQTPKRTQRKVTGDSLSRSSFHQSEEAVKTLTTRRPSKCDRVSVSRSSDESENRSPVKTSNRKYCGEGSRKSTSRSSSLDSDDKNPAKICKSKPIADASARKSTSRSACHDDSGGGSTSDKDRSRPFKEASNLSGHDKDRKTASLGTPVTTSRTTRSTSKTRSSAVRCGEERSRSVNVPAKPRQRSSSPWSRKTKTTEYEGFDATTTYTWTRQSTTSKVPTERVKLKSQVSRAESIDDGSPTPFRPAEVNTVSTKKNETSDIGLGMALPPRPPSRNTGSPRHQASVTNVRRSGVTKLDSDDGKGADSSPSDSQVGMKGSERDRESCEGGFTNVNVGVATGDGSLERTTSSPQKTKSSLLGILSQTMHGSPKTKMSDQKLPDTDAIDKSRHSTGTQRTLNNTLRKFRHLKSNGSSTGNSAPEKIPESHDALGYVSSTHERSDKGTRDMPAGRKAKQPPVQKSASAESTHDSASGITIGMGCHSPVNRMKRDFTADPSSLTVHSFHSFSPPGRKSARGAVNNSLKGDKDWDALDKLEASSTWSSFKGFGAFRGTWFDSPSARRKDDSDRDVGCSNADSVVIAEVKQSATGHIQGEPHGDVKVPPAESPTLSSAGVRYAVDEDTASPMRSLRGICTGEKIEADDSSCAGSIGGKALRSIAQQRRLSKAQHSSPIKRRLSLGENLKRCGLIPPPSLDDDCISKNDGTASLSALEQKLSSSPNKRWKPKVGGGLSISSLPVLEHGDAEKIVLSKTDVKEGEPDPMDLVVAPAHTRARLLTASDLKIDISKSKRVEAAGCVGEEETKSPRKRRTISEKVSKLISRK